MRALFLKLLLIGLLFIAAVNSSTFKGNSTVDSKKTSSFIKSCPRDCLCTPTNKPTLARCNRLEVGTQKFGSDITDLIVENTGNQYPMKLTSTTFKKLGLEDLANIKLSNSGVKEIDPKAFEGLDSLFTLNISGNTFEIMDPHTFQKNSELYLLSMSNNPNYFTKMNDTSKFIYSTSVQELDISRCGIKKLSPTTFSEISSLMYINLSGNKLEELDPTVFDVLENLEEIDLSNNMIQIIPPNMFKLNGELATLTIKNNPLTTINGLEISELLSLDITNGKLKAIGPSTFEGMQIITNLALSGNGIQKIYSLGFAKLTELSYLDLSNNDLDFLSDQFIKENVNLDVLKVANNSLLKKLPAQGFLSANGDFEIHLFDASGCSIEVIADNTFKTMPKLAQLFLGRNKITEIGSSLNPLTSLVHLDLSHNLLETIEISTFSQNVNLRKLNLAGNPLISVSVDLFAKNSLTWLDVSSCQLFKLWLHSEGNAKSGLNTLKFLNASDNQLTRIDVQELKLTPSLATLDVSNNPIKCDTAFEDMMLWLGDNDVSPMETEREMASFKVDASPIENHQSWKTLANEVCGENKVISEDLAGSDLDNTDEDEDSDEDEDDDDDDDDDDGGDEIIDEEDTYDYDVYDKVKKDKNTLTTTTVKPSAEATTENIAKDNILLEKLSPEQPSMILETDIRINEIITKDREDNQDNADRIDVFKYNDIYPEDFEKMYNENSTLYSSTFEYSYYSINNYWRYSLVIMAILLFLMIIRLMLCCYNRRREMGPKCSIITVTGSHGKVKTDCGLVYQQLTEDLKSPRTPIIRKHEIRSVEELKSLRIEKNRPEVV